MIIESSKVVKPERKQRNRRERNDKDTFQSPDGLPDLLPSDPNEIINSHPQERLSVVNRHKIRSKHTNNETYLEILNEQPLQDFFIFDTPTKEQSGITFGWVIGVFVPVLINILCVTYFMDLHRSIFNIGLGLCMIFYSVSFFISLITLINICVIATNGEMKDGGCYYLLSRTLGPELGGAIGLTLIIAHATAISWRLHYAALCIVHFYQPYHIFGSERWDRAFLHVCLSIFVLILGIPGIKFVMYLLAFLVIILIVGIVALFTGFFAKSPDKLDFFTGFSIATLNQNFRTQVIDIWKLIETFGLLFPTSNAVMSCADFSGNLKPPRRAIPLGGFAATLFGALIIMITLFLESASLDMRDATHQDIKFLVLKASIYPPISFAGFIASCIGSALTMNTGGARIIKAMVNDELLPHFVTMFSINNEPFGSHIIVTLISLIFAIVDDPNTSTQITDVIFLLPFGLCNWTVFIASSAHYPGFRPSFKFYNKWIALVVAILCIIRMFLINYILSLIVLAAFFIIYFIYYKLELIDHWGTVTQSRIFYMTLKEELNLYHIRPHVKTYRPNIIFISPQHPMDNKIYTNFLDVILHGFGMSAYGRVFVTQEDIDFQLLVDERDDVFVQKGEGFYDVTVAKTFPEGVTDLLILFGIGMMSPNTICLAYPMYWQYSDVELDYSFEDFITSIETAFDANFSAIILKNLEMLDEVDRTGFIDVWWIFDDGGLTVLIPYLLSKHKEWKKAKLRVISYASLSEGETVEEKDTQMSTLLYKFRIPADVLIIPVDFEKSTISDTLKNKAHEISNIFTLKDSIFNEEFSKRQLIIGDMIRKYSSHSSFVAVTMIVPTNNIEPSVYMTWLELQSIIKVPFCFIRGNGESTLSWQV